MSNRTIPNIPADKKAINGSVTIIVITKATQTKASVKNPKTELSKANERLVSLLIDRIISPLSAYKKYSYGLFKYFSINCLCIIKRLLQIKRYCT